jgi:alpha-glucuronidase
MRYDGAPGWYRLHVEYFDLNAGASHFRVLVNGQEIDAWDASDRTLVRNSKIDSSSSTRRTIEGVALRKGDEIRIEGTPNGGETAALDYLEILQ